MTSHEITALCGNEPFLHHLLILPNLIYDTQPLSIDQQNVPHLSPDGLVTDTQPRMAHPVLILASPALLLIDVGSSPGRI